MLRIVLSLRFVMLIASGGAAVGAFLMFWQGAAEMAGTALTLVSGGERAAVIAAVMHGTDAFLFGIVLVIFAYGIAIGFVFTLPEGYGERLPIWMKVGGVGQLKATLAEVVIVVLIVIFARIVVEANGHLQWSMLVLPASILMISAALRMLELGGKEGKEEDGAH